MSAGCSAILLSPASMSKAEELALLQEDYNKAMSQAWVCQCSRSSWAARGSTWRKTEKEAGRGSSDETAIELPQVSIAAFEILLKFVYFGWVTLSSFAIVVVLTAS